MRLLFIVSISAIALASTFPEKKELIPPGTVRITENFFIDACEINNLSWLEYEYWIKSKYGKGSAKHMAVLPDTLVWRRSETFNELYVTRYYRHPDYKNHPVVGVSYSQALEFCKWRTDRVKEFYSIAFKKELKLTYRLPNRNEWEFVCTNASGVLSGNGLDKKAKPKLNCLLPPGASESTTSTSTLPVKSFGKSLFGLYQAFGNVSEMLAGEGISKGGSWLHSAEECRAGNDIPYSQPEAWLGFRCVCLVENGAGK
jgi:formylglycine-generating enzyme required for sulfatase activity